MYAVYDDNLIWGIGETIEAAWQDAAKMDIGPHTPGTAVDPCTSYLAEAVKEQGGDIAFDRVGGVLSRRSQMVGYLVHNNAYDSFVVGNEHDGYRMHRLTAQAFRDALLTGDAQDLDNWSGEDLEGHGPEAAGSVFAVNDGQGLIVLDKHRFTERCQFYDVNT